MRIAAAMTVPDRIAAVLAPHLGTHSADSVARHLCAKYDVHAGLDQARLDEVREFLRRGLVAFVGPEAAATLAGECIRTVTQARA
jgi:exoribonuclease II